MLMNNNIPKKDEPRDRTPLEVKVDTIILFLVLITILLVVILGLTTYTYMVVTSSENSYYIINGKPIY